MEESDGDGRREAGSMNVWTTRGGKKGTGAEWGGTKWVHWLVLIGGGIAGGVGGYFWGEVERVMCAFAGAVLFMGIIAQIYFKSYVGHRMQCSECGHWNAGSVWVAGSAKKCRYCGVSFDKNPPVVKGRWQKKREQSGVYWVFMVAGSVIGLIGGELCGVLLWGDGHEGIFGFGIISAIRGEELWEDRFEAGLSTVLGWSVSGILGLGIGVIAAHFLYKMFFERGSEG